MKKCSVDLITGFLSSGKTSFINHILDDFSKEEVLVIQCEYGQEELIDCRKNVNIKKFYSMDELKEEDLIRSLKFYAPKRVFIECNGVSETKKFIDKVTNSKLKEYLKLGIIVNLIDMTTFNMFLKNIPSMIIPNISLSNLIVLNKCNEISENALTAVSLAFPLQNFMIAVGSGTPSSGRCISLVHKYPPNASNEP